MASSDWEHLQTFLSAAQALSFTGAAKALGVSQPTVSRRMEDLEQNLGMPLFIRHSRGLRLTDRGAALLNATTGIDEQIDAIYRRVRSEKNDPEGIVRLSVNEPMAIYALANTFTRITEKYPRLHLEVVVDNSSADLSRREADVAVRMFAPSQLDLLAKKIGNIELGLFASKSYLEAHPITKDFSLKNHRIIGMDRDPSWPKFLQASGLSNSDFAFRTDSMLMQTRAAECGLGIFATHLQIGKQLGLERIDMPLNLPGYEVWLVRHEALRDDISVRTLCAELELGLGSYLAGDECTKAGG